jgi:tetratricopeptide (TPR) repeat protein
MLRWVPFVFAAALAAPQQAPPPPPDKPAAELKRERDKPAAGAKQEVPPEEDKALAPEDYSFNPLQAQKDLQIGNFYFKKGSFRSAAFRYREATKWNDGYAEAWLRLGEAEEKLKDPKAAKDAYAKYLETAPDSKNAAEIRKKVEKLK